MEWPNRFLPAWPRKEIPSDGSAKKGTDLPPCELGPAPSIRQALLPFWEWGSMQLWLWQHWNQPDVRPNHEICMVKYSFRICDDPTATAIITYHWNTEIWPQCVMCEYFLDFDFYVGWISLHIPSHRVARLHDYRSTWNWIRGGEIGYSSFFFQFK